MRVAIYARTSNADAEDVAELSQFAALLDWEVEGVLEYIEDTERQAEPQSKMLHELLADARLKKFEAVAIPKLDSFGGSIKELLQNVSTLEKLGIPLHVLGLRSAERRNGIGPELVRLLPALAGFDREPDPNVGRLGSTVMRGGKSRGRPARELPLEFAIRLRQKKMSWRAIGRQLCVPASTVRAGLARMQKSA